MAHAEPQDTCHHTEHKLLTMSIVRPLTWMTLAKVLSNSISLCFFLKFILTYAEAFHPIKGIHLIPSVIIIPKFY